MRITIEITSAELAQLVDQLHLKEVPCILDELHEDFLENPKTDIDPYPRPTKYTSSATQTNIGKKKTGGKRKSRPVDVKVGDEWKSFPTPKDAAQFIGCNRQKVYDSLSKGLKCQGHDVRYSTKEEEEEVLPR